MTTWDALTTTLGDLLGELPDGTVLDLMPADRPYGGFSVRFFQNGDALTLGVTGGPDWDGGAPEDAERRFRADGWQPPDETDPEWSASLAWPAPAADYRRLAGQVTGVLRDILGVADPADLTYVHYSVDPDAPDAVPPPLGLDRLESTYFAAVGPSDSRQRPAALLRRHRIGHRVVDEALNTDGVWRRTGTLDRADLGELDEDLVELAPAEAAAVEAGWPNRSAGSTAAPAGGPAGDGPRWSRPPRDGQGRPRVPDAPLGAEERAAVSRYLREAPTVAIVMGFDPDPFQPGDAAAVPGHLHTDGTWLWSEAEAYFAERYGIPPDDGLLAHIRDRNYRWPAEGDIDPAAMDRAVRLAGG